MMTISKITSRSRFMLVAMFVICLAIALLHNPYVGYDVDDHVAYIESLAQGRLPQVEDSDEFFSPPLPYVIPALLVGSFKLPIFLALKLTQGINVILALGSACVIVRMVDGLSGGNNRILDLTFITLLTLPVWYKSHAFIRAEPYLVFFLLLYVEQLISLWKERVDPTRFSLYSGTLFGAALLSRQWAILILPAVFLFAILLLRIQIERRLLLSKAFALSGVIAFLISGWFYISLFVRFGSLTAFNREPTEKFSLKNKAASYYLGSGNGQLFTDPVRDSFDNQLIPIFYTELWGDYWQYYSVYGEDVRTENPIQGDRLYKALQEDPPPAWLQTNRTAIAAYLGRVNLISILPTAIILISIGWGLSTSLKCIFDPKSNSGFLHVPLFTTIILSTLIGYLWFLIQYPSPDGDTIKATYVLQIFPFISLLIGFGSDRVSDAKSRRFSLIMGLFLFTFIHNLGSVITRYIS